MGFLFRCSLHISIYGNLEQKSIYTKNICLRSDVFPVFSFIKSVYMTVKPKNFPPAAGQRVERNFNLICQ